MDEKHRLDTQQSNTSGVELNNTAPKKHAGGRPRKDREARAIQDILNGSARDAALILKAHIEGKRGKRTLKASLQRACEYVIDHAIGKSRQKVEHSGGVLTYKQIADDAGEEESRPFLAEVEEISRKYQEDHPIGEDLSGPDKNPKK